MAYPSSQFYPDGEPKPEPMIRFNTPAAEASRELAEPERIKSRITPAQSVSAIGIFGPWMCWGLGESMGWAATIVVGVQLLAAGAASMTCYLDHNNEWPWHG